MSDAKVNSSVLDSDTIFRRHIWIKFRYSPINRYISKPNPQGRIVRILNESQVPKHTIYYTKTCNVIGTEVVKLFDEIMKEIK